MFRVFPAHLAIRRALEGHMHRLRLSRLVLRGWGSILSGLHVSRWALLVEVNGVICRGLWHTGWAGQPLGLQTIYSDIRSQGRDGAGVCLCIGKLLRDFRNSLLEFR